MPGPLAGDPCSAAGPRAHVARPDPSAARLGLGSGRAAAGSPYPGGVARRGLAMARSAARPGRGRSVGSAMAAPGAAAPVTDASGGHEPVVVGEAGFHGPPDSDG